MFFFSSFKQLWALIPSISSGFCFEKKHENISHARLTFHSWTCIMILHLYWFKYVLFYFSIHKLSEIIFMITIGLFIFISHFNLFRFISITNIKFKYWKGDTLTQNQWYKPILSHENYLRVKNIKSNNINNNNKIVKNKNMVRICLSLCWVYVYSFVCTTFSSVIECNFRFIYFYWFGSGDGGRR